jgi:hypothetical protein
MVCPRRSTSTRDPRHLRSGVRRTAHPVHPRNAGGAKGLLENSTNLCAKPNHASAIFTAHNGKVDSFNPLLSVKCPEKHTKHKHRARRHHRRHRG